MTEPVGERPRPLRSIANYQVQRLGLFLLCAVVGFLGALLVMWLGGSTPDNGGEWGNLAVIVAFAAALVSSIISWFVLRAPRQEITQQMRAKAKQDFERRQRRQ